jgi:hypothetical protein
MSRDKDQTVQEEIMILMFLAINTADMDSVSPAEENIF